MKHSLDECPVSVWATSDFCQFYSVFSAPLLGKVEWKLDLDLKRISGNRVNSRQVQCQCPEIIWIVKQIITVTFTIPIHLPIICKFDSFFSVVTDPLGDVLNFIRLFNEKFGEDHPMFYEGTYSQVSYCQLSCYNLQKLTVWEKLCFSSCVAQIVE
jgi:hypothetical protein